MTTTPTAEQRAAVDEARAREVLADLDTLFGQMRRSEITASTCFAKAEAVLLAFATRAGGEEIEYEVWQKDAFGDGDAMVAGSIGLADAYHYAAVYSQDAPAWVVEVRRRALAPGEAGA